jgi:hypothetical protein
MVRLARSAGSVPLLVTAPSSHRPGAEPVELSPRWIEDLSRLVPLHRQYVEIVREVAGREAAPLCDLASRFASLSDAERDRCFMSDGIHLTLRGDRHAAAWLLDCMQANASLRALWDAG